MKTIKFQRPKEKFNKNCSYEIFIGEKKLAELNNGDEKTIEISPEFEKKAIKAKIQWCGSENLKLSDIPDNGIIRVSGNEFLNRKMPLIGVIFPIAGILIFSQYEIILKNIGIGVLIFLLVGLIGTLTIWKKKWIKIEKE